ncbi:guanylate cyclase [Acuticoccus sediminis]|uniref:Guanylate cyclase n=1 Tax=Acuticoccus sediminis TaxID=2184697 RepID=A0A8B2NUX9_9HYPH|nr:AAA family ATPase [Acuticoccus sediminis]RAI00110.1 guanylate cyclase [Acuticoccus sediminis]
MAGDIGPWLKANGLERYAGAFAENDVDMRALPLLTEADLRDLGLSLGHRRIALAAIAALAGPLPPAADAQEDERPHARLDAEFRLLSILFCDLVGSTALSQEIDPEAMREILTRYQDAVAVAVTRFDGYVAKCFGDGVLAYFGWPRAYEDHAERAVRAGLEALERVDGITAGTGRLAARVGIATGQVVVGDLQTEYSREDAAVAGETPNRAARIQTAAEPGGLLIDTETANLTGRAFRLVDRGEMELKGFAQAVHLFAVTGEADIESRFMAHHWGSLSPLVGRGPELDLLKARWRAAQDGEGQVVAISGEAGIGKSRLVEAFLESLGSEPHRLVRLQGSPYHTHSPLHPVAERLRRIAGIGADDPPATQFAKLKAELTKYSGDLSSLVLLADLLSIPIDATVARPNLTPQEVRERTFDALLVRLTGYAHQAPTVLVVEDAHWFDPTTLDLLAVSAERAAHLPIMIVITHRSDWHADWIQEADASIIALHRLERQEVGELVGRIASGQADRLLDDILARTDGIPLFVEELARAATEGRLTNASVPDSLRGSLTSRLDRLSVEARLVVQLAAAIGREFDMSLLLDITGLDPAGLDRAVVDLRRERLISESPAGPGAYMFRHALIQDTAYGALLASTRKAFHGRIAAALEARPSMVDAEPELLAHHLDSAGEPGKAACYWMRAARRALDRAANFEAVTLAGRALEGVTRATPDDDDRRMRARLLLGTALGNAGRLRESLGPLETAVELATELGDRKALQEAIFELERSCFLLGDPDHDAVDGLQTLLRIIDADDAATECQISCRLSRASLLRGDVEGGRRYIARAEQLARRTKDNAALFDVLFTAFQLPAGPQSEIHTDRWEERVDELITLAEQLGEDDARGRARSMAFATAAEMGDRNRMDRELQWMTDFGEERERLHIKWIAAHGRAMVAIMEGDFAAAEANAEQAFALGPQTYGSNLEGVYGVQMFAIRREQARLAEVAPIMKRLIEQNPSQSTWRPGFAIVASDLGFETAARRILDEIAEEGFTVPFDGMRSTTLSFLAEVAARLGDEARSATLYDLLVPYGAMTITAGITTLCSGAAGRCLGNLAATSGRWDAAAEHFETALAINEAMRAPVWLAHTRADYAAMLERRGRPCDRAERERLRREARATAVRLGLVALGHRLDTPGGGAG